MEGVGRLTFICKAVCIGNGVEENVIPLPGETDGSHWPSVSEATFP